MLRGTIYLHSTECTIDLDDGNPSVTTIDVIECTLSWDCDDENDPYNSTLGGLIELSTASDVIPQNIESATLYRGSDIWLTGYFKTEEETFEIDNLGKEITKYSFGCALSIAQDESIRKYMFDNDKGRFIQFDTLINDLVKGYNSQLLSDIQVNLNTPTLDQLKADCRAFYNDDANNRDVISELALTFNSRAFCFRDVLYLQQGDKVANHFNSITVTEDNLNAGGLEYGSNPYVYKFDYSTPITDDIVLNNETTCNNIDGSFPYAYFSTGLNNSLIQVASTGNDIRYMSDASKLVSINGLPDEYQGVREQQFTISYDLKYKDNVNLNVKARLCYFDDQLKHYLITEAGSWGYMGQAPINSGLSTAFDTYLYTDETTYNIGGAVYDDESNLYTASKSLTFGTLNEPSQPPDLRDIGSYYLLLVVEPELNDTTTVYLDSISIDLKRRFMKPSTVNYDYKVFADKKINEISRILGVSTVKANYYDAQVLNGVLLFNDNTVVSTQDEVLNEMNAYDKEGYKEIELYIDEYINPLNTIIYNGVNHFIQKISYNLSIGVCKLTIKECKS